MTKAVAVLFALLVAPSAGAMLRFKGDPAKPKDIKEKWSKMDGFLEVMFTMACKWKNGKDVSGQAAAALKSGEVDGADGYAQYQKDLQASNVKGLEKSCGMIIAESKKDCREGCAERWNSASGQRDECDGKCEKVYDNFERSCKSKADNLAKVYAQKSQKAAGQKQCYKSHCGEFPQVWMKADEKAMNAEVKTQCKDRCTEKNIKVQCQQKWALEVDFITASVASKCADESGVSECFGKKKDSATKAYDKCQKDAKDGCKTAFDACKDKSNADKNFKDAAAFCTDRQKMCDKQADEKCVKGNKAALDKGEKDCAADAADTLTTCKEDKLKTAEGDAEKKCISEKTPVCDKECAGKCEVTKMNNCLTMLNTKEDPGKVFCTDFWQLLHASAETDPVTGDPVALIQGVH